jgi:CRP/FNR family cyclic AMP-dependent transcriptional regulator
MHVKTTADLRRIPLFAGLDREALDRLARGSQVRSYKRGETIMREGDPSDALFIIRSGTVKVSLSDENGREVTLNLLGPEDFFGELALLDASTRSATVAAQTPVEVDAISRTAFENCLQDQPDLGLRLAQGLAQRVRELSESVRTLALLDVYGRLARALTGLSTAQGGEMVVEQRLTHQELANMVGASREMVSRIMRDLAVGGYIDTESGRIVIKRKLPAAW